MIFNLRHLSLKCHYIQLLSIAFIVFINSNVYATPEYSDRTEQGCMTCHVEEEGGGKLTVTGLEFAASGYTWPPEGGYRVLGPIRKAIRLAIGTLHIIAAFMWFGTILYVHLMLKPAYAERGLPKGEVMLGLFSMLTVGVTGILLTMSRIKSLDVLYMSPWGKVLSIKIILYLVMISSALFTVLFVGPRLKKGKVKTNIPDNKIFDPHTLAAFDGKGEAPAFVAFKGKVYDMSSLKLWKNGIHMKHQAGHDLSDFISKAPHGEEKLAPLNVVGTYNDALKPQKSFAQKAFYFIAYMNLAIVFIVLFFLAYWRWGL